MTKQELLKLPQPNSHFAMTGFNTMPIKVNQDFTFMLYGKYPAKIVSTNGLNIRGEKTYGVTYNDGKWYTTITENEF